MAAVFQNETLSFGLCRATQSPPLGQRWEDVRYAERAVSNESDAHSSGNDAGSHSQDAIRRRVQVHAGVGGERRQRVADYRSNRFGGPSLSGIQYAR